MASMKDVKQELDGLRFRAERMYSEATAEGSFDWDKVKSEEGDAEAKKTLWTNFQLKMNELQSTYDGMRLAEEQMKGQSERLRLDKSPANIPPHLVTEGMSGAGYSTLSKSIQGTDFRALKEGRASRVSFDIPAAEYKTLITLTTVSPANQRTNAVNMRLEERTVMDMIGESPANVATVEWYEETTVTNAAAETTEGNTKPEAALAWTLRSTPIATIPVWVPVTVQALDDNDFLEGQIRSRLMFMVQRREETEVLNGNGTTPNIRGILQNGSIQTQAKGADNVVTALMKAIGKVRGSGGSGFAEPTGIVMHPTDYVNMITLQSTTGDFILQAILQNAPEGRIWGLPVRQTTAISAGTALVGDFPLGATVYRRQGITVAASTEHSTYFVENKVAIRAESRIGLAIEVPTAFCSVTGL